MAESLRPWIAKCLVGHDKEFGADLEEVVKSGRCAQITQFDTYRTSASPHAQITGVISDQSNWVRVTFDVEATDDFERPKHGIHPETLTSHLRAIILIRQFRFRLAPPPKRKLGERKTMSRSNSAISAISTASERSAPPELELPVVWMDILEWEVRAGDRNEPVYYPEAVELGRGKDEGTGKVQRVLRKWWTGETNSDLSQQAMMQEGSGAGPSTYQQSSGRASGKTPAGPSSEQHITARENTRTAAKGLITLIDYIQPFLSETGTKRKAIPDWIFEMPDGVQEQLDQIEVFGLELEGVDGAEDAPTPEARQPHTPEKDEFDDELPAPTTLPLPSLTAPPAGQPLPSNSTNSSSSVSHPSSRLSHDAKEPVARKREIMDPLAFGGSSQPGNSQHSASPERRGDPEDKDGAAVSVPTGAEEQEEEAPSDGEMETDEEMLSEYERTVRRKKIAGNDTAANPSAANGADADSSDEDEDSVERHPPTIPNGTMMPPAGQPTPRTPLDRDDEQDDVEMGEPDGDGDEPVVESYSLSASNTSREKDLSLSNYVSEAGPSSSRPPAPRRHSPAPQEGLEDLPNTAEDVLNDQTVAEARDDVEEGSGHGGGREELEDEDEDRLESPEREVELDVTVEEEHDADDESDVLETGREAAIMAVEEGDSTAESKRDHPTVEAHKSPRKRVQDQSDGPTSKRPRTEPESVPSESETPRRSVLSYLNPLNLLRSANRGVSSSPRTSNTPLPDPVPQAAPSTMVGKWTNWRTRRDRSSSDSSSRLAGPPESARAGAGERRRNGEESFPTPKRTASPPLQRAGDALRMSRGPGEDIKGKGKVRESGSLPTPTTSPLSSRSRRAEEARAVKRERSTISPKKERSASFNKPAREKRMPKLGGWTPDFTLPMDLDDESVAQVEQDMAEIRGKKVGKTK